MVAGIRKKKNTHSSLFPRKKENLKFLNVAYSMRPNINFSRAVQNYDAFKENTKKIIAVLTA